MVVIGLLVLGLIAGMASGVIGIGGGILIIPALVYFFKFSQHQAQGTTLALMIPPIGILAAINYYNQGYVNTKAVILIALGFTVGGYLGSKFSVGISDGVLQRIFGVALIAIGAFIIFKAPKG